MRGEICQLLLEDPDLGRDLTGDRLTTAQERLLARVVRLGGRDASRLASGEIVAADAAARGAGCLVLEGLLLRRVGVGGRFGAELLGAGDLLRPWRGEDDEPTLSAEAQWRVLEPSRLALLDVAFLGRLATFPEIQGRLVERALRRSRQLAILMAVVHQPRLEVRLHMLMWQLAGRWGTVGTAGTRVPLALSHATLAELVAARRASVTTALTRLAATGLIRHDARGWLLSGEAPDELTVMGAIVAPDPPGR